MDSRKEFRWTSGPGVQGSRWRAVVSTRHQQPPLDPLYDSQMQRRPVRWSWQRATPTPSSSLTEYTVPTRTPTSPRASWTPRSVVPPAWRSLLQRPPPSMPSLPPHHLNRPWHLWDSPTPWQQVSQDCPGHGLLQQQTDGLPPFGVRTAAALDAVSRTSTETTTETPEFMDATSTSATRPSSTISSSSEMDDLVAAVQQCFKDSHKEVLSKGVQACVNSQTIKNPKILAVRSLSYPGSPHREGSQSCPRSVSFCAFCKGNGEHPFQYMSHVLHCKTPDGRIVVQCEVLRKLKCEICHATGDNAHTISHCPVGKKQSIAVLMKSTKRRSDGSLRRPRRN